MQITCIHPPPSSSTLPSNSTLPLPSPNLQSTSKAWEKRFLCSSASRIIFKVYLIVSPSLACSLCLCCTTAGVRRSSKASPEEKETYLKYSLIPPMLFNRLIVSFNHLPCWSISILFDGVILPWWHLLNWDREFRDSSNILSSSVRFSSVSNSPTLQRGQNMLL